MWTEGEVDLLLSVVLEYKISKTAENIDWETCQSKYSDNFRFIFVTVSRSKDRQGVSTQRKRTNESYSDFQNEGNTDKVSGCH